MNKIDLIFISSYRYNVQQYYFLEKLIFILLVGKELIKSSKN